MTENLTIDMFGPIFYAFFIDSQVQKCTFVHKTASNQCYVCNLSVNTYIFHITEYKYAFRKQKHFIVYSLVLFL